MSTSTISITWRTTFSALLIVVLAYVFWTESRYPALDEKAMMSGAIQLEDPLGFEAKFPVSADMSIPDKIFWSTLNWVNTNKKGMTFGVLFATAMLTFIGFLQRRSFKNGFANSFLGLIIGTPLGVCANCAAPIGRGMYAGGMRVETTLSVMVASPTLNVLVLTMLFSLLPIYMVVMKIALSLVVILIAVPLIARLLPQDQLENPSPDIPAPSGWDKTQGRSAALSFIDVVNSFGRNFWYITKMTVPLMLLAGFLGSVIATLLPEDLILNLQFSVAMVLVIALVGVFLPVPIAFDVVAAGVLISSGLDHGYVMALVFTLGSFSIYSWLIISQAISVRAATLLGATIFALGVLSGIAADRYQDWQTQRALDLLTSWEMQLIGTAHAQDADAITVDSTPFAPRSEAGETAFTRIEAHHYGIDKPIEFSFADMWPPFWEGRSVASGDIDRDGDLDLVIASTRVGLYIYMNDGAGQFTRDNADIGTLSEMPIFNAALVDEDNDGYQDLFITTYRQGNLLVRNAGGQFDFASVTPIANRNDAILTLALAFGDVDQDGDLDAALGNWAAGWYRRIPGEESRNRLILNEGGLTGDAFSDLPALPGETLSLLMSDINMDGALDMWVGNDFIIPDAYYTGDGEGGFDLMMREDGIVSQTTTTTMAVKTADLHNDGSPELYLAQIAGRSSGVSETLKMQPLGIYCDTVERPEDRALCDLNMEIKTWYRAGNNFDPTYASRCAELPEPHQSECKAMLIKDLAIQQENPEICAMIPEAQVRARSFCDIHFAPVPGVTQAQIDAYPPQILRSNVLLEWRGDTLADVAEDQNLHVGGWSWDTKIGDFDNDGYQDVYIVNGTWVPNEVSPSNLFFHNLGDGTFAEASAPFGLEDYLMTAAATQFDMDGDGDLDLIAQPVNGPVAVFRNNTQYGNAITVALSDHIGNRDGIGAKLFATLPDGTRLMREIQLGGGFMSFDAPVVHFGLGDATEVTTLEIQWADGPVSTLTGLAAGQHHRITRQ